MDNINAKEYIFNQAVDMCASCLKDLYANSSNNMIMDEIYGKFESDLSDKIIERYPYVDYIYFLNIVSYMHTSIENIKNYLK